MNTRSAIIIIFPAFKLIGIYSLPLPSTEARRDFWRVEKFRWTIWVQAQIHSGFLIYNERFETLRRRMILPFIDSLLFLLLRNNALKSFKNIFTFQVMQRNWQSLKRRYAVINRWQSNKKKWTKMGKSLCLAFVSSALLAFPREKLSKHLIKTPSNLHLCTCLSLV